MPVSRTRCSALALLRRAGTVTNTAFRYDPGLAAHHAAKSGALRSIRGTNIFVSSFLFPIFIVFIGHE
jgi:hypothetical protein